MAFSVKKFTTILSDMTSWIIANQDKLTDFNEGSIIRTLCEALSLEIEQAYIKTRVGFDTEVREMPNYAFNFSKEAAQKSAGTVIFSRSGTSGTVPIALATLISTTDGIQFETTAASQITNGNTDSAAVAIQAVVAGADGNVAASTITTIVTPVAGVETVDNAAATTGGQNIETDVEYLKRFQEFIEGLGQSNVAGLKAGAKSVTGVRSASVVEHFPPSGGYNATVYVDDGAGNASAALLALVTTALVGDGTTTNPGYKSAGVNIQVLAPTKVTIAVVAAITDDGTVAQASMTYLIEEAIDNYVNNLLIGEDVIYKKIIEVIMGVTGVTDISSLTVNGGSVNITISGVQIGRTGTHTITYP